MNSFILASKRFWLAKSPILMGGVFEKCVILYEILSPCQPEAGPERADLSGDDAAPALSRWRRRPSKGERIENKIRMGGIFKGSDQRTQKRRRISNPNAFEFAGSPARTRTADLVVNSHLLCQLSYWGILHKRIMFNLFCV